MYLKIVGINSFRFQVPDWLGALSFTFYSNLLIYAFTVVIQIPTLPFCI